MGKAPHGRCMAGGAAFAPNPRCVSKPLSITVAFDAVFGPTAPQPGNARAGLFAVCTRTFFGYLTTHGVGKVCFRVVAALSVGMKGKARAGFLFWSCIQRQPDTKSRDVWAAAPRIFWGRIHAREPLVHLGGAFHRPLRLGLSVPVGRLGGAVPDP